MPNRSVAESEILRWLCTVITLYAALVPLSAACAWTSSRAPQLIPQVRLCLNRRTGRSSDSAMAASSISMSEIWVRFVDGLDMLEMVDMGNT